MTIFDKALAEEIRAELARQRMTKRALALKSGLNPDLLLTRINGKRPFTMPEFFAVTGALGLEPSTLISAIAAEAVKGAQR